MSFELTKMQVCIAYFIWAYVIMPIQAYEGIHPGLIVLQVVAVLGIAILSKKVTLPDMIIEKIIIAAAITYVCISIPRTVLGLINDMTPLMIPVILYLILAATVFRWWLGDPFEQKSNQP